MSVQWRGMDGGEAKCIYELNLDRQIQNSWQRTVDFNQYKMMFEPFQD